MALLKGLTADHARIIEVLALGMQPPLWEIRPEAGKSLLNALMLDKRITAITVSSPLAPQFLVAEIEQRQLGRKVSRESVVTHLGQIIGQVRVDMDTGQLEAQLTAQLLQTLITSLLQFATGMLVIFVVLRYKVMEPLDRLVAQSEALASGALDQALNWSRSDELGVLGRSFEKMRRSLQESFADLRQRHQDLQDREAELDSQANILRTILDNMTDGITLVDRDLNLIAWNNRFLEIMGFPEDALQSGMPVEELVRYDIERGRFSVTHTEDMLRVQRESFLAAQPVTLQLQMANDQSIQVRRRPMPDGGFVSTYSDITEQVEIRRQADESRLLLEAVMDAAPAMILVKDCEFRYRIINREFLQYWKLKREEVLDKTCRDLLPKALYQSVETFDRQVIETGEPVPFHEISHGNETSGFRTLWSTTVPLIDERGKITHLVTVDLDISERKRVEQERQRWLQLLQDAIESVPNAFSVYDASQRLVICNAAFASLYGASAEALVGRTAAELYARVLPLMQTVNGHLPEQPERAPHIADETWSSGRSPVEVQLKDGRWLLVNRHPTAEGGNVFVRTDITYLKQMEQALRESEQRFRSIFETVEDAIITAESDGRVIEFNPAAEKIFGYCRSEPVGRAIAELIVPSYLRNRHIAGFAGVERSGESTFIGRSHELEGMRSNGEIFPIELTVIAIKRKGQRLFAAFIRDITERKRIEAELARHREALHQSEKLSALGTLLAGVAHELNNPLSVVVGRAMMLEEQFRGSEIAKSMAKVRAAAERCARIVKTFLAMARQQQSARVTVQISKIIAASLDMVGYKLRESEISVTLDIPTGIPDLKGDPDQLVQVFTNLFINAQQALTTISPPRQLTITARFYQSEAMLSVQVRDNGSGIAPDILPRIFEPFFTTKPVGEGTGIGLSVSHAIIQSHGGALSVDLPADGGTLFEIRLPVETGCIGL